MFRRNTGYFCRAKIGKFRYSELPPAFLRNAGFRGEALTIFPVIEDHGVKGSRRRGLRPITGFGAPGLRARLRVVRLGAQYRVLEKRGKIYRTPRVSKKHGVMFALCAIEDRAYRGL